ncbi:MAG: hypothetical protein ACE37N_06155, partial [Pseudohongiellaceae bacterium]
DQTLYGAGRATLAIGRVPQRAGSSSRTRGNHPFDEASSGQFWIHGFFRLRRLEKGPTTASRMFFIVVGELFRMTPEQLETVFSNCFKKLCLKTVLNEAGQFGLAK